MNATPVSFRSKKDGWLVAFLLAVIGIELTAAVVLAVAGPPALWFRAIVPALLAAGGAGTAWLLFGTSYAILGGRLVIRSGPLRWRIALATIENVTPSRALNSAPALSLDRVEIRHRGSAFGVLVSPDDREAFLEALLAACPHLQRKGDGLERG